MSFSIGIIGLPNTGKSTLFQALTKNQVDIANYPFTTITPNIGVVAVPDQRLEKIAQIIHLQKVTPTIIKFVDIAGLVKGAHKGEGLGNQFLAQIRECDAILEIVRAFTGENIEHVEKSINPERDIEIIKNELIMKDLETLEKILEKGGKILNTGLGSSQVLAQEETLRKIRDNLLEEKTINQLDLNEKEASQIKPLQLLTAKPIIYVINISKGDIPAISKQITPTVALDLKLEQEISELSETEAKALQIDSRLDQLIISSYDALNLITFYTIKGGKEVRAWTLENEANILEAAGKVHSDFREKFIKAEVIGWKELVDSQSWVKAKEKGKIRTVGKEYAVKNGDIIEFKI